MIRQNNNTATLETQERHTPKVQNISESAILQSLAIYFSAPSPKPIPYEKLIHYHGPAILKYLFPFFHSNFNKNALKTEMQFLVDHMNQVLQQILKQEDFSNIKLMLNRFLSIYNVFCNFNGNNIKTKIRFQSDLQHSIIKSVISNLQRVKDEDVLVQIVNKIIVQGYHGLILQQQASYARKCVIKYFNALAKPHKILINTILKKDIKFWKELVKYQRNFQIVSNSTSSILSSQELLQNHAEMIAEFYYCRQSKQQIQQSMLNSLCAWWTKANDSLNTQRNCQFKTNLLAILIQKYLSKQHLVDRGYTVYICQGIHKRLSKDGFMKKASIVVWYRFANKLGFEDTVKNYQTQSNLFQNNFDIQKKQQVHQVNKQSDIQQICLQQKIISQNNRSTSEYQENQRNAQQKIEEVDESNIIMIKPPRNIYDCILGMRNPSRRKVTMKYLPAIIIKYSDDLTFCWLQLCQELIAPLYDQNAEALVVLFTLKPIQVIDVFSERFFKSDCSMNERITLMQVIRQAIEQLASNPKKYEREVGKQDKDFYFKKVTSRYYNENAKKQEQRPNKQQKTRRWGYTKLQYERKNTNNPSVLIINNDPYINRLYEIANAVFFKLISKLPNSQILLKNQQFVRCLLILFSSFIDNIKNHFQKYSIICQVIGICETLLSSYKQKQTKNILTVIQVLLKTSIVVDRFIPQNLLASLVRCVQLLMQRKQYGINHFIQAIQENIYSNMKITTSLT